jgi:multicomponent Na+:H+ antiporter subunit F
MITFFTILLIITCFFCLFRVIGGPTPPDRTVAIDVLGIVIVGFCALIAIVTGQEFYLNVAISWAMLSFIGTMALAKYLEGRGFDE